MLLFIDGICFLLLSIIVYQDFKFREITALVLFILTALFLIKSVLTSGWHTVMVDSGLNILFLVSQFALVTIYFSARKRKIYNLLDSYLGKGDIFLMLGITVLFSVLNFIVFYVAVMLISLLVFGIFLIVSRKKNYTIPLAGSIGIQLIILLVLQYSVKKLNFRDNEIVTNLFQQWMI